MNITLEGGKYTVVNDNGKLSALRYGEPWRDCGGDGLMQALVHEIEALTLGRDLAVRRLQESTAYAIELREKLNKYKPGAPMHANAQLLSGIQPGTNVTEVNLVERAAKNAGYAVEWCAGYGCEGEERDCFVLDGFEWNPLADDGDALRLAVKLGLTVYMMNVLNGSTEVGKFLAGGFVQFGHVMHEGDPAAAARRAIVRAAAEIGSQ